jgi:nucleotide-binding universal stress UspA family protein
MQLFSKDKVLVPIDFSEESFEAQELTLDFVANPTNLYVIHILPYLTPSEPGIVWEATDDELRKEAIKERYWQKFNQPKYQEINLEVAIGDPSSEILDYAKRKGIELIVIPSHGRTGIGRFFLGSVAERVVRFAHCPVLVLRRDALKNTK